MKLLILVAMGRLALSLPGTQLPSRNTRNTADVGKENDPSIIQANGNEFGIRGSKPGQHTWELSQDSEQTERGEGTKQRRSRCPICAALRGKKGARAKNNGGKKGGKARRCLTKEEIAEVKGTLVRRDSALVRIDLSDPRFHTGFKAEQGKKPPRH